MRMLPVFGLGLVVAAGALFGGASPSAAATLAGVAESVRVAESVDGADMLQVSPGSRLFDVSLRPGDSEVAVAGVRNGSQVPLRVELAAARSAWSGHERGMEKLFLAVRLSEECTVESMADAPKSRMSDAAGLALGVLEPGVEVPVCLLVTYPDSAVADAAAVSVVDLRFDAIQAGTDPDGEDPDGEDPDGAGAGGAGAGGAGVGGDGAGPGSASGLGGVLALTGAVVVPALVLGAVLLLCGCVVVMWARRRSRRSVVMEGVDR